MTLGESTRRILEHPLLKHDAESRSGGLESERVEARNVPKQRMSKGKPNLGDHVRNSFLVADRLPAPFLSGVRGHGSLVARGLTAFGSLPGPLDQMASRCW